MHRLALFLCVCAAAFSRSECQNTVQSGTLSGSVTFPIPTPSPPLPDSAVVSAVAEASATGADHVDLVLRSTGDEQAVELSSLPTVFTDLSRNLTCTFSQVSVSGTCAALSRASTTYEATLTGTATTYSVTASVARLDMAENELVTDTVSPARSVVRYIDLGPHKDRIMDDHLPISIDLSVVGGDTVKCTDEPKGCTIGRITVGTGLCPTLRRLDDITTATFSTQIELGMRFKDIKEVFDDSITHLWVMVDMPLNPGYSKPSCNTTKEFQLHWGVGERVGTYTGPMVFTLFYSLIPIAAVVLYTEYATRRAVKSNDSHKEHVKRKRAATIVKPAPAGGAGSVGSAGENDEETGAGAGAGTGAGAAAGAADDAASHGSGGSGAAKDDDVPVAGDAAVAGTEESKGSGAAFTDDHDDDVQGAGAVLLRVAEPPSDAAQQLDGDDAQPLSPGGKEAAELADADHEKLRNYAIVLFIAGFFFAIPAFQVVGYGLVVSSETRNSDVCYFNTDCFRPWGFLYAGNAFVSNLPYVLLGFGYLFVLRRRMLYRRAVEEEACRHAEDDQDTDVTEDTDWGLPRLSSLRASGGVSLVYIGVFSAAYHVCPTSQNFTMDASFMLCFATVMWLSIYAARHRFTPRAEEAVFGIGLLLATNAIGTILLHVNRERALEFWVVVAVVLLFLFLLHAGTIWYRRVFEPDSTPYLIGFKWIVPFIGHIKHDCNCGLKTVLCRRLPEAVLFLVQAVAVLALTAKTASSFVDEGSSVAGDAFAKYLMAVTIVAFATEYIFYQVVKRGRVLELGKFIKHPELMDKWYGETIPVDMLEALQDAERFSWANLFYLAAGVICFGTGFVFFSFLDVTNKTLDPAASRELNKDCSVFSFYDNHDTWHLLSAYGIFFVLMHIETADERLWGFKRKLILRAGGRW